MRLDQLRVKIFADTADLSWVHNGSNNMVRGWTTNPTLLAKAKVTDYESFARKMLAKANPLPVSVEVFADDWDGMAKQARIIASWDSSVWVKIPVTNTKGESTAAVVRALAGEGLKVNVTAIFTMKQVREFIGALGGHPGVLSIFAGRIADTMMDPSTTILEARLFAPKNIEILWASPREVLNIWQADQAGADIITCGPDILAKLALVGKDLTEFSLDTVKMFRADAVAAGYQILDPKGYGGGGFAS